MAGHGMSINTHLKVGSGYMAANQYVDGYWIGADGACN